MGVVWYCCWLKFFLLLITVAIERHHPLRAAEPVVDFARDVRPLLATKCFACHGPDEAMREAGLRLDLAAASIKASDNKRSVISPGRPDDSELIKRVTAKDSNLRMPPDGPLSEGEIKCTEHMD